MLVDTRRQNTSTLTDYKSPYESMTRRCLYTCYSASRRDPFKISVRHAHVTTDKQKDVTHTKYMYISFRVSVHRLIHLMSDIY